MSSILCVKKKKNKANTTRVRYRSLSAYSNLTWKIPEIDKYQLNQVHELACFDTCGASQGEQCDIDVIESTDIFTIFGKKVNKMPLEVWE